MDKEYNFLKDFIDEVQNKKRFFVDDKYRSAFELIISSKAKIISVGQNFYRGRKYENNQKRMYSTKNIGMPLTPNNSGGRFNALGINYFYLSGDVDTVIAELRPNIMQKITIGRFVNKKNLKIVDLTDKFAIFDTAELNYATLTLLLGYNFTKPINSSNKDLDYLPMQYFSELCRLKEYDGIMYFSSLFDKYENKYNIVLFSEDGMECVDRRVIKINSVKYDYK